MKEYQKPISTRIYFLILLTSIFSLFINTAFAAQLEVQYPPIAGQTLAVSTKLSDYALYLFNAGMFIGFFTVFVSLVVAGAMYLLSSSSTRPDFLADAKDRISGAISGLLILALTYLIMTTINPQLGIFKVDELPQAENQTPAATIPPGVYLYGSNNCTASSEEANFSFRIGVKESLVDLADWNNRVHSVGIVHGNNSYITVLYENPNFWGKCQYIDPNSSCTRVENFASSASIHAYDFSPNGDGVYFYRKPCFANRPSNDIGSLVAYCKENGGGYYKVKNSEISGIYTHDLNSLKFEDVPEEEQDCVEYDELNECIGRSTPTLGGENISSVIIKGDYLVLFVYFDPEEDTDVSWTYCQEFPSINDVNRIGPQQMKWENIRNNKGVIPNYVVIIPIKR